MPSGIVRALSIGAISATTCAAVLTGAATSAFGAARTMDGSQVVTCPTVAVGSGQLDPAPSPGVDWSGCNLTGADFANADISGADLSHANLTTANLTDANTNQADFAGAKLFDANAFGATLTDSNFTGANLTFFEASNLTDSDLANATITEANFGSAILTHVRSGGVKAKTAPFLPMSWSLTDGLLIGPGADFSGMDLSAMNLSNLNLSDTDLAGANLTNASLANDNLASTDVQGANFTGVTWPRVESGDITGTPAVLPADWTLADGYLMGPQALLNGAELAKADLAGLDLAGASLFEATLTSADLTGADLTGTDLTEATLTKANLTNSDLTGAFLDGAVLTSVTWSNTICPDGTNSDAHFETCANNIDDAPPSASPVINGLGGSNGWFTGPVTVVWHWTDGTATIDPSKCPARTTSKTQGRITITGTCFNALGAEGTATENVDIDTVPPAVAVTGVASGHVYPLSKAPAPGCRTTDATSRVGTPATVTIKGPHGAGVYTATCAGAVDRAGNKAAPVSVSYTVRLRLRRVHLAEAEGQARQVGARHRDQLPARRPRRHTGERHARQRPRPSAPGPRDPDRTRSQPGLRAVLVEQRPQGLQLLAQDASQGQDRQELRADRD